MSFPIVTSYAQLALYLRPSCPYCMRVLDFCQQNDISLIQKNIAEGENLEALMIGGGKRQVPCLKITDESGLSHWMYESLDIIEYIRKIK